MMKMYSVCVVEHNGYISECVKLLWFYLLKLYKPGSSESNKNIQESQITTSISCTSPHNPSNNHRPGGFIPSDGGALEDRQGIASF